MELEAEANIQLQFETNWKTTVIVSFYQRVKDEANE